MRQPTSVAGSVTPIFNPPPISPAFLPPFSPLFAFLDQVHEGDRLYGLHLSVVLERKRLLGSLGQPF